MNNNEIIGISYTVPVSNEEYEALLIIGKKYFTNRVSTVIRNIVRDEIKSFVEQNEEGIYVKFIEGSNKDKKITVTLDNYSSQIIKTYTKKLEINGSWLIRYLIRPHLESILNKEA